MQRWQQAMKDYTRHHKNRCARDGMREVSASQAWQGSTMVYEKPKKKGLTTKKYHAKPSDTIGTIYWFCGANNKKKG